MLSGALLCAAEGTVDRVRYSMVPFPSTDNGQIWAVGHYDTCCLSLVLPYDIFWWANNKQRGLWWLIFYFLSDLHWGRIPLTVYSADCSVDITHTGSAESRLCGINTVCWRMSKMLNTKCIFMWLISWEDWIAYNHYESKSYVNSVINQEKCTCSMYEENRKCLEHFSLKIPKEETWS
jgi:hypothetical protein